MLRWISIPRIEGTASRQAHADLPEGTFERELGREGFYGPSTQMHHRHPPTGWIQVEGPLRPRAFDTTKIPGTSISPWQATPLLGNQRVQLRLWRTDAPMDHLARNGDGDELLFVHEGEGDLYCDYGHLTFSEGDYLMLPRGTLWRIEIERPAIFLLIEASNDSYRFPEKGIVGAHAVFDPAVLAIPRIDEAFSAQQSEQP